MKRKKATIKVKEDRNVALIEELFGNEDLLTEILLRVPAKSLVKFKCVSKHWLSLISDEKFCHDHSARCPKVASAIYYYSDHDCEKLKSLSLNGHRNLPTLPVFDTTTEYDVPISVVHSCNGLILCTRMSWMDNNIWICNLTTNKYKRLQKGDQHPPDLPLYFACISYDPAKSPFYKIVLTRNRNLIDIYSSENHSWKRIQLPCGIVGRHRAFWDGSIHWIWQPNTYLKFEVDKKTVVEFSMPPKHSFPADIHYFGECGENLILVTSGFRILEMKKGSTNWTMKQQANLRPIIQSYPENKEFHVLSVLKGSLEGDVVLVLAATNKIFKYDLRCKMVEVICDFEPSEFQNLVNKRKNCFGLAYHFIESLVPL